jgi:hypothetical protein
LLRSLLSPLKFFLSICQPTGHGHFMSIIIIKHLRLLLLSVGYLADCLLAECQPYKENELTLWYYI